MPRYSVINKKTKKEYELDMSFSEFEQYLKDNPKMEQVFRMNIGDPVGLGITKPSKEFQQNVINRIKKVHPHHNMHDSKFNSSNISEI